MLSVYTMLLLSAIRVFYSWYCKQSLARLTTAARAKAAKLTPTCCIYTALGWNLA